MIFAALGSLLVMRSASGFNTADDDASFSATTRPEYLFGGLRKAYSSSLRRGSSPARGGRRPFAGAEPLAHRRNMGLAVSRRLRPSINRCLGVGADRYGAAGSARRAFVAVPGTSFPMSSRRSVWVVGLLLALFHGPGWCSIRFWHSSWRSTSSGRAGSWSTNPPGADGPGRPARGSRRASNIPF